MLRISETSRNEASISFKLEGKVLAPWLDEVRRICAQPNYSPKQIRLDLREVSFVDTAGAELLSELIHEGITISACSGFIAEVLHLEKH